MTYQYTFSISADLSNGLHSQQLHEAIDANATITANLIGIHQSGNAFDIYFDAPVTGNQYTALQSVLAAHIPDTTPKRHLCTRIYPNTFKVISTGYTEIASFTYIPATSGTINYIDIVGYKHPSATNYSVRAVNSANGLVIAEATFTNIIRGTSSLGTISNIPLVATIIDIHVKVGGGSSTRPAYVNEVLCYCDE